MFDRVPASAFRRLERRLWSRRWQALDPWLRAELLALAVLLGAFCYWRSRVPLDGVVRSMGPARAAGIAAATLALLAAVGAVVTSLRLHRALTRGPAGPAWLTLPIEPAALARHLAWAARGPSLLAAVPAAAVVVAMIGLLPVAWIPLLAALFLWLWIEGTRLGGALALRRAAGAAPGVPGLAPVMRALVAVGRTRTHATRRPAGWRREPAWRALLRHDLALTIHSARARRRALIALALALAAGAAWFAPAIPELRRLVALALALLAAMAAAEWTIEVSALHPAPLLRSLPVGVASFWGSRLVWAALAAAGLAVSQRALGHGLSPIALDVHAIAIGASAFAVGVLGANYAVTLHPRADAALRLLTLSLGLAVIASLMIPLVGWVLLLTAVLHSMRRLPGWTRSEA